LPSSFPSARHDQIEKLVGLCRIEASQFPNSIQGSCPVTGKGVSDPEVVPGIGILRVYSQDLAVGFNGVIKTVEDGVSNPKLFPGGGIIRIDLQGLTVGCNDFITPEAVVSVPVVVSVPEEKPCVGVFRFSFRPL
jgi:hypothetical protein